VVETQPATIAEFGSPQTGPNGEPNRALLAAQAPLRLCSGPLRFCSGAAQPRLRVKQRLLRVEALTGAGEKKSYVQLLGYSSRCFESFAFWMCSFLICQLRLLNQLLQLGVQNDEDVGQRIFASRVQCVAM
jgi:hypothetical protein